MRIPDHFKLGDQTIRDKKEIANKFNNFFATIGNNLSDAVPNTQVPFTDYLPPPHHRSMFLDPVTPQDTIAIASKLKSKNSKGHDDISTKLEKNSIEDIALPLTHIINQSLLTGMIPEDLKIARVIPIFKSGDRFSFNNYRPISILPLSRNSGVKKYSTKTQLP